MVPIINGRINSRGLDNGYFCDFQLSIFCFCLFYINILDLSYAHTCLDLHFRGLNNIPLPNEQMSR